MSVIDGALKRNFLWHDKETLLETFELAQHNFLDWFPSRALQPRTMDVATMQNGCTPEAVQRWHFLLIFFSKWIKEINTNRCLMHSIFFYYDICASLRDKLQCWIFMKKQICLDPAKPKNGNGQACRNCLAHDVWLNCMIVFCVPS